jgi:hypothetical protein
MSEHTKFPWKQYGGALAFYALIAGGLVLVAALLPGPLFSNKNDTPSNAALTQQQQVDARLREMYAEVLTRVGKLTVLPDLIPQISLVEDANSFVQQNPTFKGTMAGDIVLIYPDRVIIYSPKIDRIIHTALIEQKKELRDSVAPPSGDTVVAPTTTTDSSGNN